MYRNEILAPDKISNPQMITTLEIAEMMETDHAEILKKLEGTKKADGTVKQVGIIPTLGKGKIPVTDYFIKSSYLTSQNKEMPCYNVTRMGCDFLANKFTGEKGIIFTAKYVKRFHEMEQELKPRLPLTYRDAVAELLETLDREEELKAQLDTSKDWYSIKRVAAMNGVDWRTFNWRKLKNKSIELGYGVKKIFDANYGEVNIYHRDVWEVVYPEYEI